MTALFIIEIEKSGSKYPGFIFTEYQVDPSRHFGELEKN